MFRLLADECMEHSIIEGLARREPSLDILIVSDEDLRGWKDHRILELAANEDRILLTHDRRTMTKYANERVAAGLAMPGVIIVKDKWAPGPLIDDILLMLFASEADEFKDCVRFVPL